jgi:hypothetical protein
MKHPSEPDMAQPVAEEASPPPSWWAYCSNAELDYWEGRFDSAHEATEHARATGLEEFWIARCGDDDSGSDDFNLRLLTEPKYFGGTDLEESERYEVVEVRGDGSEVWHSCLDAVEFGDGRLAAEVIPGEVIFRRPGRWRKVSAAEKPAVQP